VTTDMTATVIECIEEVIKQNDLEESTLKPETIILAETSLDSLALAEVIVYMEAKTQKDPFADGFINFQTVEELAHLYEQ